MEILGIVVLDSDSIINETGKADEKGESAVTNEVNVIWFAGVWEIICFCIIDSFATFV